MGRLFIATEPASLRLPSLRKRPLDASAFTATEWSTSDDKAKWGNAFLAFCAEGFPNSRFTRSFYTRLSMCFGHIAHYDFDGFWSYFFSTTAGRIEFLEQTLEYGCYGSPAFTFCDVEKVLKRRVAESGLLAAYRTARAAEIRTAEMATLQRLQAKYAPLVSAPVPTSEAPALSVLPLPVPAPAAKPVQLGLL